MEKFRSKKYSMEERARSLVGRLTLDEKIGFLSTHQQAVPRLGIKEWHVGAEVARGYVSRDPKVTATVFPEPIGMSGTFDTELMYKIGEAAGEEARIIHKHDPKGHLMLWGPTVDMCRNPLWGRNEEGYGEDPYLTGQMSAAYTLGLAKPNGEYLRVIPTLKHFCANNTEVERGSSSSNIDMRTLHEYYYAAFKPAITEGGARSVMAAYNELSGVPGMINPDLKRLLKAKWGMIFAVTDGGDFSQNVNLHHYSATHAETLALGIKNGMDVMTDDKELVAASARKALKAGLITVKDIDEAVYNSLLARFRLGEFDEDDPYPVDEGRFDCEEFHKLNLRAACEQIVLLKNDGVLPLKDKAMRIAVIGESARQNYMDWYTGWASYNITVLDGLSKYYDNVEFDCGYDRVAVRSCLNGKYLGVDADGGLSASYDRDDERALFELADHGSAEITLKSCFNGRFFTDETMKADSETTFRWFTREIFRPKKVDGHTVLGTYFDGALAVGEDGKLICAKSFGGGEEKLFDIEVLSDGCSRAAALAKGADAVVFCGGNDPMIVAREMYDRTTLALPESQQRLLSAVHNANPRTVAVLISGYPYSICEQQRDIPAIVYTSHAGSELGTAVTRAISGEYNPAGRLAQTWYANDAALPPITDYDIIANDSTYLYYKGKPLYPFGYGLSYSTFEYSALSVTEGKNTIAVSLDVKNTSQTDGEEVVQIYFSPLNPRVKRPIKQLCAFKRAFIKAGQTAHIELKIKKRRLEFYDVTREKLTVESGEYVLGAGASSEDIRLSEKIYIHGETIPPRCLTKSTKAVNFDRREGSRMLWSKDKQRHYMAGGVLFFDTADLNGVTGIEISACTEGLSGEIAVRCLDGEEVRIKVGVSPDPRRFAKYRAELHSPAKVGTLMIRLPGHIGIMSFKLIKE